MVDDDETPWWMQTPEREEPGPADDPSPADEERPAPLRAPPAPHQYLPRPASPAPSSPVDPEPPTERLEHPGLTLGPEEPPAPPEPVTVATEPARDVLPDEPGTVADDATEIAPPPRLPRSSVRRVAVVEPSPPPRPVSDPTDRTEQLPQVADEIFATFSGPGGPDPVPDPDEPGAVATRTRPRLRTAGTPGRGLRLPPALAQVDRQILMFGATGLVLVVLLVVLLSKVGLFGGGDPDPQASGAATPRTEAVGDFSRRPDGLSKVSGGQAATLLAKVNQSGSGSVVEAWTWNDKNGKNLIATLREPAAGGHVTLRVVHAAELEDDGKEMRVMTDPDLPRGCSGTASFTPKSLQVADLDGDGVAEIAAGWTSQCSGASSSEVRLALISDGKKYIVRGTGVVGKNGSAKADPDTGSWPSGYAKALGTLFGTLYYKP